MTEWQAARRFAQTAQKWRDLVNQRCAHFIELHKTGRWTLYYGEAQFLLLMREAVDLAESWAVIAPRPEGHSSSAAPKPAAISRHRPAA
ncbi:MAG TPA: hypothetical protein VG291_14790 [Xanthobacteraceae bacterium]|jgi:hypothetical protein|nr:hypothetical protein [Xanthobacteraceae bacterium]